nr:sugar transferase [Chryseobacterium sp. HSC-36S06]
MKPVIDFVAALAALVLLSPVFVIVGLILAVGNRGTPFFVQRRPGKHGRIFKIIKFKTMNDQKDEKGNLLPDYRRLTFFGRMVRKTSLDEIPQLINVLKGEMSLVGPRPLLPEYLPLYSPQQQRRHDVKPGITGWAQVNGRNALSWEEKFAYDVEYVEKISPALDARIVVNTVEKVVKRHGVNANNYVTMEAFKGNAV